MSQSHTTQHNQQQHNPHQLTQLLESCSRQQASEVITVTGPISFILQAQLELPVSDRLGFLNPILDQYCQFLAQQSANGQQWIKIEEPAFAQPLSAIWWEALEYAFSRLSSASVKLLISGINQPAENLDRLLDLQADGIELDFSVQPQLIDTLLDRLPGYKVLSARFNNPATHNTELLNKLNAAKSHLGERLWLDK